MISRIDVRGFKRLRNNSFTLNPLTILTGLNGSGKSSFVQAALLAREAACSSSGVVRLNDVFGLCLGTADEVKNWQAVGPIAISVHSDGVPPATWSLDSEGTNSLFLQVASQTEKLPTAFTTTPRAFTYLSAERLGPRNNLPAASLPAEHLEVGTNGEHCAQLIAAYGSKPLLDPTRVHPHPASTATNLLKYEVEAWLSEIARPIEIDPVPYPGGTVTALQFRSPGNEWVRAPNMGFGVSYALPIVLAGLLTPGGGLLIVENPEAHLHPAGQSRMGTFLAWLASHGVQVMVETHSDHLLNGVRRGIAEHQYLNHDDAIVHFFSTDDAGDLALEHLTFLQNGGISHWPDGFFDQFQMDVQALGRIRRRKS